MRAASLWRTTMLAPYTLSSRLTLSPIPSMTFIMAVDRETPRVTVKAIISILLFWRTIVRRIILQNTGASYFLYLKRFSWRSSSLTSI